AAFSDRRWAECWRQPTECRRGGIWEQNGSCVCCWRCDVRRGGAGGGGGTPARWSAQRANRRLHYRFRARLCAFEQL
ncbi:hypothetical protein GGH14_005999, partial [Coemansia sp. RSA 370]